VCVIEREIEREIYNICVCVCVCERERERERICVFFGLERKEVKKINKKKVGSKVSRTEVKKVNKPIFILENETGKERKNQIY